MTAPYCLSSFHGVRMTAMLTQDATKFKDLRYAMCYVDILRDYAVVCREFGLQENAEVLINALRETNPSWCLAKQSVKAYVRCIAQSAADEAEAVPLSEKPKAFHFVTLQAHAERYLADELPEGHQTSSSEEEEEVSLSVNSHSQVLCVCVRVFTVCEV
jgi:hypothetical protein